MSGIDFLVGGLPRGGTTLTAKLFNSHPDCFSYSAETHILPLLHEFFERGPLAVDALAVFEAVLRKQNQDVLVGMIDYNISIGADPALKVFDERLIAGLEAGLLDLARAGFFGREMMVAGADLVGDCLREGKGARIVGEKTPSNVFPAAAFGLAEAIAMVNVVREPFAVVASSARRAKDETDLYNSGFFADTERNCGSYVAYLEAMAAMTTGRVLPVHYEDLQDAPQAMISKMFAFVGAKPDEAAVCTAARKVDVRPVGGIAARHSREDVFKILTLTEPAAARFGYCAAWFAEHGAALDETPLASEDFPEGFWPLSGFYPARDDAAWMQRSAEAVVYASPARDRLALKVFSSFPPKLSGDAGLRLVIRQGEVVVAELAAPAGPHAQDVVVRLDARRAARINAERLLTRLSLEASDWYRPSAQLGLGDRREFSFRLSARLV